MIEKKIRFQSLKVILLTGKEIFFHFVSNFFVKENTNLIAFNAFNNNGLLRNCSYSVKQRQMEGYTWEFSVSNTRQNTKEFWN